MIVKCLVSIIFFQVHAHIKFVRKGRGGLVYDTNVSTNFYYPNFAAINPSNPKGRYNVVPINARVRTKIKIWSGTKFYD